MFPILQPGQLATALAARTLDALAARVLLPVRTEQETIEDGGIRFVVRAASNLTRKSAARSRREHRGPQLNPFLPPDPALTVGALTPTHTAILNKFNVLDGHLLIVTNAFEHQNTLLRGADFQALAVALREIDGLGFYNGGAVAGASEPHKHLQLVPLPLTPGGPAVPTESLISRAEGSEVSGLPYRHAYRRLDARLCEDPERAAAELLESYQEMLAQCSISTVEHAGGRRHAVPYNLLVRRSWMLLVPRSRESWHGISINALGFAGSLFVPDAASLDRVREAGPVAVLRGVTR